MAEENEEIQELDELDEQVGQQKDPDTDEALNLDVEALRTAKIKKIMKIIVLCLLIIGGLSSYILIKFAQEKPTLRQLTPITADGTVIAVDDEQGAPNVAEESDDDSKEDTRPKANYYNLTPAFTINLVSSEDDKRHYVQFSVSIMTRDPELFGMLEHHDPVLKSAILNVASTQKYEDLATLEGRKAFKAAILHELKTRLDEVTGKDRIEEVLFTKFIME